MNKDRRIERTNELIFNAFLQLIVEQGYAQVSVQDIVDQANIGRSTFYTHYDSKEDVLDTSLFSLFDRLYENIGEDEMENRVPAIGILLHLHESIGLRSAFDLDFIADKFQQQLQSSILTRLPIHDVASETMLMRSHILAGSFISLMKWWIKSGMVEEPTLVANQFSRFVFRC